MPAPVRQRWTVCSAACRSRTSTSCATTRATRPAHTHASAVAATSHDRAVPRRAVMVAHCGWRTDVTLARQALGSGADVLAVAGAVARLAEPLPHTCVAAVQAACASCMRAMLGEAAADELTRHLRDVVQSAGAQMTATASP